MSELHSNADILIVIVNYRTAGLTIGCLASLEPEVAATPGTRVVVTDNASGDGSASAIAEAVLERGWGPWVTVQPLEVNGGFAAGNNAAIRPALESAAPPRLVWLLNPDTIVKAGALRALLELLEERPEVGLVGSRLEDLDGTPQRSAFRFPTILSELEHGLRLGAVSRALSRWVVAPAVPNEECATDWVAGASLMVRREVFEAVGLLDEEYFMYYEEVDFCLRARRAGWACWYAPGSRVVHLVGQSSGVTDLRGRRRRRPSYWFEARRRYFRRNLGRGRALLADLAWSGGYLAYRVRRLVQRKPDFDPPHLLGDFLRHSFLPRSLRP